MRDAAEMDREQRGLLISELRRHAAVGETALIEWAADDAIERAGWTIEKGSGPYRELCQRLTLAWLEALTRTQERDQGHFNDTPRSEEHTSELQSLMRISYAVFCLKKNK